MNGTLPGYIATERVAHMLEDSARRSGRTPREIRNPLEREIPLGKVGSTKELAWVAPSLSSDLSACVACALIPVGGGLLRSVG